MIKNETVTKPEELVRLYDLLLQNTSDLSDLVSSGRDRKKEEIAFSEECEAKSLSFRAERCFFLAKSYSLAGKRTETYSLNCLSRSLAEAALKELQKEASTDQALVMELEDQKVPEYLSQKISNVSISGNVKKLEKLLLEKLDSYESAVGDSNMKAVLRIETFPPVFQAIPRNPIVLDLAYNSIEFPSLDNRMKKDRKGT